MSDRPLAVTYRPLTELVPYARNARRHSPAQIAKIKASLQEFGWANAMLVANNEMIAGHARLEAALELLREGNPIPHIDDAGFGPTIDLSHLTPTQRRAYVLADNRLAEEAIWDLDLLRGEFEALRADDGFDLALAGFGGSEVESILNGWNPDFTKHENADAAFDPLMAILRLRYQRSDRDDVLAAIKRVLAPFANVTIEEL